MTDGGPKSGRDGFVITRERLLDGTHLRAIRARATPDYPIRTDEELDASLDDTLAGHAPGADIWVFGYGSLMWNPAFLFEERVIGTIRGYHRRFCLRLTRGRGSPECPGLMLALDRGGICRGIAFRIPSCHARSELLLVWRPAMLSGACLARWVTVSTPQGPIRAVTFVANQAHRRYCGQMAEDAVATHIVRAAGELGTCRDYFDRTLGMLRTLEIEDRAMERIRKAVQACEACGADRTRD